MTDSSYVDDRLAEAWRSHRPYLVNLAYQMLGDIGEAEDVAQEAYLRLAAADLREINDVRAWLTVVAGRLCLDQVRSARARREKPASETALEAGSALHLSREIDPADRVTLDDQISDALLEVLRRLSPGERVAFVLHDVFQIPFDAIAETVGRPVGTCRQLARRARVKVHATRPNVSEVTQVEHRLVTDKFIAACASGDLDALTAVLDQTVWGVGTVLAEPALPPQVNYGPTAVATNLLRYLGPGATLVSGPVGEPVLLAYAQRRLFAVIVLTLRDNLVMKIEATADPAARGAGFAG
ncbi:MAG: RNA polymerase sigma factor SigI [Mycobacteriaceae bacterium]|nr:RNA polymerase sigma factor SigI [Mycobacteriaceae bacterium]MBV9640672.1 RNA polymerase sigma factor SigI [Mycobacteriaceae bacterium]